MIYNDLNLNLFKPGEIQTLVATDFVTRGIDTNNVTHVVNYQYPFSLDSNIHRIGRVGITENAYTSIN